MKADIIRKKLAKYLHKESDTILLEIIEGKPRSEEGGVWIDIEVTGLETVTEELPYPDGTPRPPFDPETSGYRRYLDRWLAEGLITEKERRTGKS